HPASVWLRAGTRLPRFPAFGGHHNPAAESGRAHLQCRSTYSNGYRRFLGLATVAGNRPARRTRGGPVSTLRKIAEIPAGSWTKWLVVGFWVAVLAVATPLSLKLKGAEKNNTAQWVPAGAESTKVLGALSRFQSPNISAAIVVYDRPSGVTTADRAKAAAD